MSQELIYLLLIFGLLVIPRFLQQFKLPAPLTCLAFGVVAALVIGKPASNVPAAQAMDYVFGYLNFIDGSARGLRASNSARS